MERRLAPRWWSWLKSGGFKNLSLPYDIYGLLDYLTLPIPYSCCYIALSRSHLVPLFTMDTLIVVVFLQTRRLYLSSVSNLHSNGYSRNPLVLLANFDISDLTFPFSLNTNFSVEFITQISCICFCVETFLCKTILLLEFFIIAFFSIFRLLTKVSECLEKARVITDWFD